MYKSKTKIKDHPKLSAAKYYLGLLGEKPAIERFTISVAEFRQYVSPDYSAPRKGFADEEGKEAWKRGAEPDGSEDFQSTTPEVEPEALKTFNAGSQQHQAFDEARKIEETTRRDFANIDALLADLQFNYGESGEYVFPTGVTLAPYLKHPNSKVQEMAVRLADAFADLGIKQSPSWRGLDGQIKEAMQEIIRRTVLGVPLFED